MKNEIEEILKLIKHDKVDKAFEYINSKMRYLYEMGFTSLEQEFRDVKRREMLGLISLDDYLKNKKLIISRLISILEEFSVGSNPKTTFLTESPVFDANSLYVDDEYLNKIYDFFDKSINRVCILGIGGIGKSTIAKKYYHNNSFKYNNLVWINIINDIEEAFVHNKTLLNNLNIDVNSATIHSILKRLSEIQGVANLLVIDGNTNSIDFSIIDAFLLDQKWHKIITSRSTIDNYKPIEVNKLSDENANKLFKYHTKDKQIEQPKIDNFLTKIKNHPLTIELVSKTISKSNNLKIDDFLSSFEKRNFDAILSSIPIKYSNEERDVVGHLLNTFNVSKLDKYECWVLKQFTILPPRPMDWDNFSYIYETYFELSNKSGLGGWISGFIDKSIGKIENIKELDRYISLLVDKGWLQKEGTMYHMHPVLREVLFYNLKIRDYDVSPILSFFLFAMNTFDELNDNILRQYQSLSFFEEVYSFVRDKNGVHEIEFKYNLSRIYFAIGRFKEAFDILRKENEISHKNLGENHILTISIYTSLCLVLNGYQKYQETLSIGNKIHKHFAFYRYVKPKGKFTSTTKKLLVSFEHYKSLIEANSEIALIENSQNHLQRSIELYLDIRGVIDDINHPIMTAKTMHLSGDFELKGGDDFALSMALANYRMSHEILSKEFGELYPEVLLLSSKIEFCEGLRNPSNQSNIDKIKKIKMDATDILGTNNAIINTINRHIEELEKRQPA